MHAQQRLICIDICVFKGCKINCSCHDASRLIESFFAQRIIGIDCDVV